MTVTAQLVLFAVAINAVSAQTYYYNEIEHRCPKPWISFQDTCYRFIKSFRSREEARRNCQAYQSELLTINSLDEHNHILRELLQQDPQHRKWYTGVRMQGTYWTNDDGTQLINMENSFLPDQNEYNVYGRDYLVYGYSELVKRWGLEKVSGHEPHYYICEAPTSNLAYLLDDNRDYQYGIEVNDPLKIPRGPYFIKQPVNKVFDVTKRVVSDDVTMGCLAGGYPAPTYEWFKEDYHNDKVIATKIDPLANDRYTVSGGTLIIFSPNQTEDRGSYHCKATNKYGTIRSESVELSFGYILEFNLKRPEERGDEHWGKAIYCDPPQHFPGVKYYWAREAFPYFVDDDNERLFVSNDGALYFSALEKIDQANYSCNVQSTASDTGRNGPFFPLYVSPHLTPQNLKFPNNFPKIFPEAPIVGDQVRMECIAFGFPVPSYNWTRLGSDLPRGAYTTNHNRVLIIPRARIEDQGEYVCRARNEKISIKNSVYLSIQAAPNFTVPLVDKHVDNHGDLTWICEAFGIPDVSYTWYRNGEIIDYLNMPPEDRDRYIIQDNVLKIKSLDPEKDEAMYQCEAKNQLKTRYSSAQLRVLSLKPSFKKFPLEPETFAAEGGNVTMRCNPEAAPKPKFTWKKDGNVIGSGGRRRILDTGTLMISPVSRDDEGTYYCQASNQYGNDESRGRLIVLNGPRFIESLPQNIPTAVNWNQTLRCQAETDEMLDMAYLWLHNDMLIRDKDLEANPHIVIDGGVLDIINATLAEAGVYECIVTSAVGNISSRTTVTIRGPPGPPGGVQVVNVVRTSVTLSWTDGAYHGKPINKYCISAKSNWNQTWFNLTENYTNFIEIDRYNGRKQVYLENVLKPFTIYEFRVQAGNELGYGPPSMSSPQYSTPPDKPQKAPSNIRGGGGKIGDLTIKWDPLPNSDHYGPGIFYKVFWRRKVGETEFQSLVLKEFGNTNMAVVTIQQAYFYTEYEVQVQAANAIGYGPKSEIVTIYSAEDMPQVAPQYVSAVSYNSTALNVTWNPIEQTRERVHGKLIGHRIKYWKETNREEDAVYYLSRSTRPWSLVVGLQPNTYYYVKVMAYNSAGEGPESERYLERTYRKAPQNPPSSVFIRPLNPKTIRVTWRYVQNINDEEPVIGFKIRVWESDQDMSTAIDTLAPVGSIDQIIDHLTPGKEYRLRVLAYSNGGDGRMSSPAHTFRMGDDYDYGRNAAYKKAMDVILLIVSLVFVRQFRFV
ncbi:contactin [Trichogramma pretiosum]|uniref:contactin n=1 Tax=Trichogramma pretiosum TaxID=7493 RepID=UPI0006C96B8C|nr:contactin [Trichogramma pretiosum]XP_014224130.1 contactin [Trichogramma pretiosum]